MLNIYRVYVFFVLLALFFQSTKLIAQNSTSYQFWPEIDITSKPFNKSTIGIDMYSNRELYADHTDKLGYQSDIGGKIWFNHYFKSKVKTSAFFETIQHKASPEAELSNKMEFRIAAQNVYYSPFKRWTLQNRIRVEDRIIENDSGNFVNAVRPRYMLKAIVGINKKLLIQGTLYMLVSNEIMLNLGSSVTGYHIFDRNLSQIGLGYCITNSISLEAQYAYTVKMPANGNISDMHAFSVTIAFNNVFSVGYFKGYFKKSNKNTLL